MSNADDNVFGEDDSNPFAGIPFLGDMMKALGAQGSLNWDLANQFATMGAGGDTPDPEPDTATRLAYNSLADIADRHVAEVSCLPTGPGDRHPEILTTTRARWAHRTMSDLRPLFNELATSLGSRSPDADTTTDPLGAMFAQLSAMMAPSLMGMSIGSMVGALARHALGQYDLPLARPHALEILVVSSSVDSFAAEWSIARDDMRMWVLVHELASHAILAAPGIAAGVTDLVSRHVSGFRPDPSAIMDKLGDIDMSNPDALAGLQSLFGDPLTLLGAVKSADQELIAPLLEARLAAVSGYIDWVVDTVGTRMLGNPAPIAEAVRRRRVDFGPDAHLIEMLLGVSTTRTRQQRGRTFIEGIVERAGPTVLPSLVSDERHFPTPNEVDAPGLWLARLEIDS
jgi:putative hydrolase